jgi:hypothetical protein
MQVGIPEQILEVIKKYDPCYLSTSEIIEELNENGVKRVWASYHLHSLTLPRLKHVGFLRQRTVQTCENIWLTHPQQF